MSYRMMLFVFTAAFTAVLFTYAHPAKAQAVPDGLIAYWTFDDIDGDTQSLTVRAISTGPSWKVLSNKFRDKSVKR